MTQKDVRQRKEREFKFYPEDFDDPPVKILHMDLRFDIYADKTHALSTQKMQALEDFDTLNLDADDVDVQDVECDEQEITWKQDKKNDKVIITFSKPVKKGDALTITIKNIIIPTHNILEGLYYDVTPKGAPPQMITQCQQWGFRRLVPTIDEMTTKCTYLTTITARKEYTNVISNGDQIEGPKDLGNGRVEVKYDNTLTPMATYLFFLGVGTWDNFRRELEYPDGKTFTLELLAPVGSDPVRAGYALDILHDAIEWVYLFTGRDKHENRETALKLWELLKKREELKKKGEDVSHIREEMKQLAQGKYWGYQYTGKVYREIAMQNSNFGGMENVGNTTITANRIMPYEETTDNGFEYMTQVKAHEFYHNLNGSEVTGWSPFDIWLNEAVTVHVEKENHAFNFGEDYSRLSQVQHIMEPTSGTLAMDAGPASMPIEPEGFNNPDDMITGITYVKAPEFVRMIQTLMGDKTFVKGLDLYHTRFKHANAKSIEWVKAMEEKSGLSLQTMAKQWLKQVHFPLVNVSWKWNNGKITLTIKQVQEQGEWSFPFVWAVFDKKGNKVFEKTQWVQSKEATYTYECPEPGFLSLHRGFSFFGKIDADISDEELSLQLKHDDDIIAKWLAWYEICDREKTRLLKDKNAQVSEDFVDLYCSLLTNKELIDRAGAQFLALFEGVEDETYAYKYQDLYDTKKKILTAIAQKYEQELLSIYETCLSFTPRGSYLEREAAAIKNRQLQNICLSILAKLDTPKIHELIKKQLASDNATNRVVAFKLYLNSSAPDRKEVLKEEENKAKKNLVRWETFLHVVGSSDAPDYLDIIRYVESLPEFDINQSNDQRGLYLSFAMNRKKSLLTEEGRAFLREKILQLGKINQYNTMHLLKILQNIDKLDEEHWVPLIQLLQDVISEMTDEQPMVLNGAKRILKAQKKALKKWEEHQKSNTPAAS
ncbi:DUF3458 domain-containing protein [Candidatus Woesearchaeota archaeon]|nr:MAG: DUF3458 domain-containing protein [Candidatus Woesearchaeota archaeon]